MKISIDVIIPSFRLEEKYIVPVLQLTKPLNAAIKFYLIADNPEIELSASIISFVNNEDVFLIINKENMGAAETRNAGMAAGIGDWILFLDDDIIVPNNLLQVYATAIETDPSEIGFIGLINFPQPATNFTKAIKASGSMDIFSIASRRSSFAWGATANIMIKRRAIGAIKFSTAYPKPGGGEDVDFFLKIRKQNGFQNFKTLAEAAVQHPWWNGEQVDFKRPFRYGKGNSHLGFQNPEYTYYDFPNTPETLLISCMVGGILFFLKSSWFSPTVIFTAGIIIIEIIAGSIQTIKRYSKANLKIILNVIGLRFTYETGVLAGKLSRFQLWRIGERFHDNGSINKFYFYRSNTYKTVKWILYLALIFWIIYRYKR